MDTVTQFIRNHMDVVFFIYGLSFFSLGTAVFFQVRKGSDFRLGKYLWMLAAFGLLHGVNEWLDLFEMVKKSVWTAAETQQVEVTRSFIGKISYVFLFQFGIQLLCRTQRLRWLPRVTFGLYSALILFAFVQGFHVEFGSTWLFKNDALMRYVLAFPSAMLTAIAFFRERRDPDIQHLDIASVSHGLTGLSISFLVYAVLAGLIVKPNSFFPASVVNYENFTQLTGLPVQFFRTGCAISMVYFLCRVLNIFEFETMHKLDHAYREIIRISNREQMRIGQDLHDDLGQQLTGIAYMFRVLAKKAGALLQDEGNDIMAQIRTLLDRSIDTTRNLSRGLYPVSIEKEGLGFALHELAENTEKIFGVTCSVQIEESVKIRSNETAIQLFRIAQEAITNSIKHGNAHQVDIVFERRSGGFTLAVLDDGSGLSDTADEQSGIGLKIMRYRAGVLGGQLSMSRRSGGGTLLECSFGEMLDE